MLIDPQYVVFETKEDIVDYITKGILPPKRSHFNKVITKIKCPDNHVYVELNKGKEVVIEDSVILESERELMEDVMKRVYENRVTNRNILLGSLGAIGSVFGLLIYLLNSKKK